MQTSESMNQAESMTPLELWDNQNSQQIRADLDEVKEINEELESKLKQDDKNLETVDSKNKLAVDKIVALEQSQKLIKYSVEFQPRNRNSPYHSNPNQSLGLSNPS